METTKNILKDAAMTKETSKRHHTALDRLFRYADFLNFGEVHVKFDHETGLRAIVAIHNLKNGPAIGGCRLIKYDTTDDALEDALRLGYMMSYKASASNLAHGGAKAVIMMPKVIKDRVRFFEVFGDFVNSLGGKYITAVDSGTSPSDMDIVERRTPYVTCTTKCGDPSPQTALGVRRGMEAAVKFKLGKESLKDIHVTIQGAGHVGYYLAKELHACGARLTMCDMNQISLDRCVKEFGAETCAVDAIYDVKADIFAPCALGAVLNLETINRLNVPIVAGSANNQLAHHNYSALLQERGILYAPDFVINAGGLIYVAGFYDLGDVRPAVKQVENIYQAMMDIFEKAKQKNCTPLEIAEGMALARLR